MRNLTGIEPFVAVAETGSFTKAAERLQTAKSSISDSVRGLEDRLGVRLIERTTRHLRLTDAGTAFYTRCRKLLDELDLARAEARAFQSSAEGHLRVAVPETLSEGLIIPCLTDLLTRYPKLSIDLIGGFRISKLVEEEFDLAIRIINEPAQTLVVRRVATQRVVLVAAPAYLDRYGSPEKIADLDNHRLVGTAWPLPWTDKWLLDGQDVSVKPRIAVNTAGALRSAALAGIGLVPVPDWLVLDELAAGRLKQVLGLHKTVATGIYAVYPTHRHLSSLVRVFVEHIERYLRQRGVPLN